MRARTFDVVLILEGAGTSEGRSGGGSPKPVAVAASGSGYCLTELWCSKLPQSNSTYRRRTKPRAANNGTPNQFLSAPILTHDETILIVRLRLLSHHTTHHTPHTTHQCAALVALFIWQRGLFAAYKGSALSAHAIRLVGLLRLGAAVCFAVLLAHRDCELIFPSVLFLHAMAYARTHARTHARTPQYIHHLP